MSWIKLALIEQMCRLHLLTHKHKIKLVCMFDLSGWDGSEYWSVNSFYTIHHLSFIHFDSSYR